MSRSTCSVGADLVEEAVGRLGVGLAEDPELVEALGELVEDERVLLGLGRRRGLGREAGVSGSGLGVGHRATG